MTSLSPEFRGGPSPSMARSAIAEVELEGWARIAEGMLAEAVLVTLCDVQEPQARAQITADCAAAQLELVCGWAATMPPPRVAHGASSPSATSTSAAARAAMDEELAKVDATLRAKRAALQDVEARVHATKETLDALWSEQADVSESLATLSRDAESARHALFDMRAQQAQEDAATAELRQERAAVAQELDDARAALGDSIPAVSDSRSTAAAPPLRVSVRALVDALAASQAQLRAVQEAQRMALSDMASARTEAIAELDAAVVRKQSALQEVECALAQSHKTMAQLAQQEAEARRSVESLRRTAAQLDAEGDNLREAQAQQEAEYTALQQDTIALQEERAGIVESVEALEAMKETLCATLRDAAAALHLASEDASAQRADAATEAIHDLVQACEASRAREHQAAADLAAALERLEAYESAQAMRAATAVPEPAPRAATANNVAFVDHLGEEGEGEGEGDVDGDFLPVAAPAPRYQRVLPPTAVNPVTASLLRVKAQARELREPSLGRLTDAIASPARRPDARSADGSVHTPRPASKPTRAAAALAAPTPALSTAPPLRSPASQTPTLSRTLYYSQRTPRAHGSYASRHAMDTSEDGTGAGDDPLSSQGARSASVRSADRSASSWGAAAAANGPSASWKSKMDELQSELRGLRSDLGAAK